MVEQILNWVIENLTSFGMYNYFFAFGMLILCGFGLPIPEDITLVAAGVVSGFHATNPHVMLVICFIGVLLGDGIVYMLGKTMSLNHSAKFYLHIASLKSSKSLPNTGFGFYFLPASCQDCAPLFI